MDAPPRSTLPLRQAHRYFWDLRRATGRLTLFALLGVTTAMVTPHELTWRMRGAVGWCVTASLLIVSDWWIMLWASAEETARSAGAEDLPRAVVWLLTQGASLYSFFAACLVLRDARHLPSDHVRLWTAIALVSIVLAWVLNHTAYALRYAHLYYRDEPCGIVFNGRDEPCYVDFAYLAFTIGMAFSASGVDVTSTSIRRVTLLHALTSFVFNVVILALAINIAMLFLR